MMPATKDQPSASIAASQAANDLRITVPAASKNSTTTAVLAPSTRDTHPISKILQPKQKGDIQRDLQLTEAQLDEHAKFSPEWFELKEKQIDLRIKSDTSNSTRNIVEVTKSVAALMTDEQLDNVDQHRVNNLNNPSVATNSDNEEAQSNNEFTYGTEAMGAQFCATVLATSFDDSACSPVPHIGDIGSIEDGEAPYRVDANGGLFSLPSHTVRSDDDACSPNLSDEESRDVGNIIVAEKAVLSSPSRFSQMDKTFASSDESSQGDEEAVLMAAADRAPSGVEDINRRRETMIAMCCCIVFLIVLIPILVVFVGQPKKRSDGSAIVGVAIVPMIPVTMSPSTSNEPSVSPSSRPSISPTMTTQPSSKPSISALPSASPSVSTQPTSAPSAFPSAPPFVLFTYGESFYTDANLDIQISVGLTAKRIAQTGSRVDYANGGQSSISYHGMMDGAGIALLPDGGYVYMSNSEKSSGAGGVYGLYFNRDEEITNYKALLTGTSRNCGGGISPWHTWISCEEVAGGQCWQVEPDPDSPNHNSPKATLLGGSGGGSYETVAVDSTDLDKPIFFTTEDTSNGELRRFEADGNGWDALHVGGRTTYLQFLDGKRFQWTTSLSAGENSAANYYPNAEGIVYHNSTLYFVAKETRTLFILDLNDMTYTSERTGSSWVGQGSFNSQPDQIIESDLDIRKYIYFTEDGGNAPGVHVRDREGKYYTMVRAVPGGKYSGDETVGIAFSPDRKKFYFGFQDAGVLMEVTRDDGHTFN
jgi:hypothetical protein